MAGVGRKRAAIMAADVAGYAAMMAADEEGTHARLGDLLRNVIEPLVTRHGGEVFKTTGDGFLAEFASSVGALRCAIALQRTIAADRTDPAKAVLLRIGINAGDVMVDQGDVFGQAVNIAARLESIAEPGGICISDAVYDQTRGRFDFAAQDRGEQLLKNIPGAIRAWAVTTTTDVPADAERKASLSE